MEKGYRGKKRRAPTDAAGVTVAVFWIVVLAGVIERHEHADETFWEANAAR